MYYQEESQGFSWNKKMGIAAASLMLAGGGMLGVATVINSGSALDSAVAADQTVDGVAQATDGIGTSPGGSNAEPVGQTPTPGSGGSGGSGGTGDSGGSGGTGDSSDLEPSAPGTEPEPEPSDPPVGDPDPGNPNPGGPWELELPDGPMAPPAADPTPKPNPHPPLDLGDNLAEEVKELLNG